MPYGGLGGSVWVMGEWSVSQWILGVMRFQKIFGLYSVERGEMVRLGGFGGSGGSVWVMGEWSVGQWIVGVISFKKIYGLYGLKHHIVEKSGDVTDEDGRTTKQQGNIGLLSF